MPTSTSVPFISRGGIDFPKPSPRDKARILHDLRAARRELLKENLKATGLAPEQAFSELEGFDNEPPYGDQQFLPYVSTPEGQEVVLLHLLRKTMKGDGEAEAALDSFDEPVLPLICDLFGYTPSAPPATEGTGDSAHPTAPAAETNPTGNPPAYQNPLPS